MAVRFRMYYKTVAVDCDCIPAAIVAVTDGEPLIILASERTLINFDKVMVRLGLDHVALANKLRREICGKGGEFCEQSIAHALWGILRPIKAGVAMKLRSK